MRIEKFVSKYKDTISDFNALYTRMINAYQIKDFRVEYLRTFEFSLGQNVKTPLELNPAYFRLTNVYPLGTCGAITEAKYRAYVKLYEYIMRDEGLLDTKEPGEDFDDAALGLRTW